MVSGVEIKVLGPQAQPSTQGHGPSAANSEPVTTISVPATAQQPGPPRRSHKKSRNGCARCKARKIKCDERHPACLNCISHGVKCPFLTSRSPTPNSRGNGVGSCINGISTLISPTSPHIPQLIAPSASPTPPVVDPERHEDLPLLELELLHNFTTLTYSTLAVDPGVCDFWRVTVVQIGLQCDYIMRAVLAISALHLAYHRPERRDFYTAQGIVLHQKAARSAMRFIAPSGIESLDDAVNLFVFSMLTIYFALASPRSSLPNGSFFIHAFPSSSTTFPFPDWTFLLSGAKSISAVLGTRGHSTVLAPFLAYGHIRYQASRDPERNSSSAHVAGVAALRARILGGAATAPVPSHSAPASACDNINDDDDDDDHSPSTFEYVPTTTPTSTSTTRTTTPTNTNTITTTTTTTPTTTTTTPIITCITATNPSPKSIPTTTTTTKLTNATIPNTTNTNTTPTNFPNTTNATTSQIKSSLKESLKATYAHALDELELALVARQDAAMPRDVLDAMLWLWEVSDSLVPLLKPGPVRMNTYPNTSSSYTYPSTSHTPTTNTKTKTGTETEPETRTEKKTSSSDSDIPETETETTTTTTTILGPTQEAVVIFAHFSILLKHHESHWWLQGWAEHLISRAYEILDDEHRSWIEWPMREVGWMPSDGDRGVGA